jgi:molecular chaperone IbpA
MRNLDLSPFRRSSIGFERMLNVLDDNRSFEPEDYPPYDIVRTGENGFCISLAIPGFKAEQINIIAQENTLTVTGTSPEGNNPDYLYRGIARGPFERRFNLADYIEVKSASFEDGVLQINLEREVPEAMKPRKIEINAAQKGHERKGKTFELKRTG